MNNSYTPFISVLLPVYNCEKYIAEAVQSILNQTYTHFELLIIDDCSTDTTLQICKSFQDERIVLIEKEKNSGITKSLNYGISIAKGKYIARMDGDDISLPERFEKQVAFLEANEDVVLCGTQYQIIGTNKIRKHPIEHDEIKVKLISGCYIAHPTVMFNKNFFVDNNLNYNPEMEPAEDYDLWSRLVFVGRLANLDEVLLYYRVHTNQTSNVHKSKQNEISDGIKMRMLQKLKTDLKKADLSLNIGLSVPENLLLLRQLKDRIQLLKELDFINKTKGIYNSFLFKNFIKSEKKLLIKKIYINRNVISFYQRIALFFYEKESFKILKVKGSLRLLFRL